jgi:type I restriction enzyme S subunit
VSTPAYLSYRSSGSAWLGDVPASWDVLAGRRVFAQRRDAAREGDEQLSATQRYGVVPQREFMEREDQKVMLALGGLGNFKHVEKDDFVISLRSFEGGVEHSAHKGCVSPAYTVLRLRHDASARYFRYLLKSKPYVAALQSTTDSLRDGKSIGYDQFGAISLPVPPFPEQTAIAAFLDRETGKIDALVEEQQRLIELLKEKRQAVISHSITKGLDPNAKMKPSGTEWLGDVPEHWTVTKLGRYISILSGFAFPSTGFSMEDEDVRLLRGINVGVGNIRWDEAVYWKRQAGDGLDRFELKEGQIIVGMDRPWIADGIRVARVTADDVPSLLLQRVTAISCKANMSDDFAYLLLTSQNFVAYFTPDMTGVSVPHLSPEQIELFRVAVPSPAEQAEIVASVRKEIRKIDTLLSEVEGAVRLLLERRSALISAAVTGKIDVRLAEQLVSDDAAAPIADEVAA